jgi:6-phosphogluconolactonase
MSDLPHGAPRNFTSRAELYDTLGNEIATLVTGAVAARGRATLAVPGGSTPIPLFDRLATQTLPWQAVSVTLTDERWVPPGDGASNEGLLRRRLAREHAAAVTIVGLWTGAVDPAAAVPECARRLAALGAPLDAVILGCGEDGHVASLFPGIAPPSALDPLGSQRCLAVTPPGSAVAPGARRLSLTLAALLDTRRLILLVTGAAKRAVIDREIAASPDAPASPLAAVLRQRQVTPEVWWSA